MGKAYECEGQMSIFDLLAPQTEKKYKPGEWVDKSELGMEISFDEIVNMIGQLIILDKSTVSHEWFKVVKVEQIVINEGQRRLVYYDGERQRGLINEVYFNLEDSVNGFAHYRQYAYKLKGDVSAEIQEVKCKHSGHVCNKENVWEVADTLDDKSASCPHICCRQCSVDGCGARCVEREWTECKKDGKHYGKYCSYEYATEIVRKGGVNERL